MAKHNEKSKMNNKSVGFFTTPTPDKEKQMDYIKMLKKQSKTDWIMKEQYLISQNKKP